MTWTLQNTGTVPWLGRRLKRIGPHTGPWTLTSALHATIPDTQPGETVLISVEIRCPHIETAQVAQWKMVDEDDLLYFPDRYSMGVGLYVRVSTAVRQTPRQLISSHESPVPPPEANTVTFERTERRYA